MTNLDFWFTKESLTDIASKYSDLKISWVEDEEGYKKAKEAWKELQKVRKEVTIKWKELRDEAIKTQKNVLALEKELLVIITTVEDNLKEQIKNIDQVKEMEKRKKMIPIMKEELKNIGIDVSDSELLMVPEKEFSNFVVKKKEEKLQKEQEEIDKKNREQQEQKDKRDNFRKQEMMRVFWEIKQPLLLLSEEEFSEKIKKWEEQKKEQEEKRIQEEADKKLALQKLHKKQAEEEEQKRLQKEESYRKFLKDNEWKFDKIVKEDWKVVLYKKVAEFII